MYFILIFCAVAVIGATVQLVRGTETWSSARIVETLLLWTLAVCVGAYDLLAFAGHVLRADDTAKSVGWPAGNPFQLEAGMGYLAFASLGIACIWQRGSFWYAVGLGQAIYGLGLGAVHIDQLVAHDNHAANNSGIFLYSEIGLQLALLGLLAAHWLLNRSEAGRGLGPSRRSGATVSPSH